MYFTHRSLACVLLYAEQVPSCGRYGKKFRDRWRAQCYVDAEKIAFDENELNMAIIDC